MSEQTQFKNLYAFIERAVKSRKYPNNTGYALKVALSLFESELNDEERSSLNVFKKNLDQIYRSVCLKNSTKYSAGSLATYKARVIRTIKDYEHYGIDLTKMAGWNPKIILRKKNVLNQGLKDSKNNNELTKNEDNNINSLSGKYSFVDSGEGWQMIIKSERPITIKMKKALIEVFEEFEDIEDKN